MKAELKWLEDPRIFRINRLDAHSDHMYYGSEAEMEAVSYTHLDVYKRQDPS